MDNFLFVIWFQDLWGVWLAFSGHQIMANRMATHYSAILKNDNCLHKLVSSKSSINTILYCTLYLCDVCSDGRTVAIKKIPRPNFSVTMNVRKDVRQIR